MNRVAVIFWLTFPWILLGCGMPPDGNIELPRAAPGLELQTEDYAHARSSFRTKLVRKGPAPHQGEPPKKPLGAEEIDYRSGDLPLKAYLGRLANDGRKRPAVLVLHGGFAYGEGQWAMARPFRDAGFVVMMPVLRGATGQAGDFTLFYDEVDDVLAAADTLASLPSVDASRIYVCGHSVGETLALLAAMASNRFRAASSLSGSPDLESYLRVSRVRVPFDPSDIREVRLRSPVAFAASFKCPVRLFCGDEEFWVQGSTQRTAMLAKQGASTPRQSRWRAIISRRWRKRSGRRSGSSGSSDGPARINKRSCRVRASPSALL